MTTTPMVLFPEEFNDVIPERHEFWVPACGGSEIPFRTRCGRTLHYLWCPSTNTHAYYDCVKDLFLTDDEARQLLP